MGQGLGAGPGLGRKALVRGGQGLVPGLGSGLRLGLAARVVRWSRRSQMHQGRCLEMGAAELRCAREGAPPAGWHLHHLTLGVEVGGVPLRLGQVGHCRHACRVTEQ